jgi:filamentous hemagglutinin family protein
MITKSQPNQNRPWKQLLLTLSVACSLTLPMQAALPTTSSGNLSVINGTATTSVAASTLTITATDKTVLSWVNFWDGTTNGGTSAAGDVINYALPAATASILNSVTGGLVTTINGEILSNGRVFIQNPAGVTIGSSGVVNVAAFGISTLAETFSNFTQTGTLVAFGNPSGATGSISVLPGATITTVGDTGNVYLAAPTIALSGVVTGNALLYGTSGGAITVGNTSGATTISGALTVASNGGSVTLGNGAATNIQGALNVTTNGGGLNAAASTAVTVSGNTTIDTSSAAGPNGNVTEGTGTFAASTAGTTTMINTATAGNPSTTGATAPGTITMGAADFANLSVVGGTVNITDNTTNTISLGTANVYGSYNVTSTGGNISTTAASNIAVTASTAGVSVGVNGTIALTAAASNKSIVFSTTAPNTFFSKLVTTGTSSNSLVTVSTTGNLMLGGVNTPTLTASATGNMGQISALTVTKAASFSSTNGGLFLDSFVNTFGTGSIFVPATVKIIGAPLGAYVDSGAMILGNGTNATGNVQLTTSGGNIQIGTAQGDTIKIGGGFGVDIGGGASGTTVTTLADNLSIGGPIGLAGNGSTFTLGTTTSTTSTFGSVAAIGATALTINSAAAVNLGGTYVFQASTTTSTGGYASVNAVAYNAAATTPGAAVTGVTAGALTVNSMGAITNPVGAVTATTATLSAGTTAGGAAISIGSTATPAVISGNITDGLSSSLTLVENVGSQIVVVPNNAAGLGTLNVTNAGAGGLSVAMTGGPSGTGGFTGLSFALQGGGVVFTGDPVAFTLSNASNLNIGAPTVTLSSTGGITLGTGINLNGTGANSLTAGGNIVDTAGSSFYIAGATTFTSGGSINLANGTSNNVGTVTLNLTGTAITNSIAYAEGSTVRLGGISIAATGSTGSVTISSATGDIIEAGAINLSANPLLSGVTFNAVAGAVTLTNANLIGTTTSTAVLPVSINALNASALTVNDSLMLGKSKISNGGLTLNTVGDGTSGVIVQKSGTSLFVYGNPTFVTAGAAVTLTQSGNNFGAITVDTTNAGGTPAGATVNIRETATNNYAGVRTGTAGAFTALDDTGDIIETPSATIVVGGKTTLTATAGSVLMNDPVSGVFSSSTGSNLFGGGILAIAANNIAITDGSAITTLVDGTKAATGTLAVTNTAAGGGIVDGGSAASIISGGNATFITTPTGYLNLSGLNSSFGALLFSIGSGNGGSTITENATTNVIAGSIAQSNLTINSGGGFITSGSGAIGVNGNLTINALNSIIFSNQVNVTGVLTVKSISGPTNLSIDSVANNLSGHQPVNNGNQTNYTGPNP